VSKKKKKPAPISMKLSRAKAPTPKEASKGINDVSPIVEAQMKRAERAIDSLREEVQVLRKAPPKVSVESSSPKVDVIIPARPRINKITIKYDQLGYPSELIPQYSDATG
jgi:hypothetical protein